MIRNIENDVELHIALRANCLDNAAAHDDAFSFLVLSFLTFSFFWLFFLRPPNWLAQRYYIFTPFLVVFGGETNVEPIAWTRIFLLLVAKKWNCLFFSVLSFLTYFLYFSFSFVIFSPPPNWLAQRYCYVSYSLLFWWFLVAKNGIVYSVQYFNCRHYSHLTLLTNINNQHTTKTNTHNHTQTITHTHSLSHTLHNLSSLHKTGKTTIATHIKN